LRPPRAGAAEELLGEGPERSLGSALNAEIASRAVGTAGAATGAWVAARLTGRRRHADTVGLVALIGSQLGQTVLGGGLSPSVVLSSVGAAAVLVAVVQTPGVSRFFGCTPLGPAGWTIAGAGSAAGVLMSLGVQPLVGRLLAPAPADLPSRAAGEQAGGDSAQGGPEATQAGAVQPARHEAVQQADTAQAQAGGEAAQAGVQARK
jgi:hypothetical protein